MHAFLLIGDNQAGLETGLKNLTGRLKAKTLEFPLAKIEDVRNLNSFTNLKVLTPTAIVIRGIDAATLPAQNAFLKNLEEPQANLYYFLTALSEKSVLPTIASRCQISRVGSAAGSVNLREIVDFLKMDVDEKLGVVDKIRRRDEAIAFTENLLRGTHRLLVKTEDKHNLLANAARAAGLARSRLKANGNVQIQLTNLVLNC